MSASATRLLHARLRLLGLAGALAFVSLATLTFAALNAHDVADAFEGLGTFQLPLLVGGGTALVVALVPASLVLAACGYLLGTPAGLAVGLLVCALASAVAAAIARAVGGEAAPQALGRRAARATIWIDARPLRSVVVSRLVPGTPFNLVSYVLGLSRIGLGTIAVGSLVGFAPRALVYTALGGSLAHLDRPEARVAFAASLLLLLASFAIPRVQRASPPVDRREPVDRG